MDSKTFFVILFIIYIHGVNSENHLLFNVTRDSKDGLVFAVYDGSIKLHDSIIGRGIGDFVRHYEANKSTVYEFSNENTRLEITTELKDDKSVFKIKWKSSKDIRFEDCINLKNHQWYGGPQQREQYWPVQKINSLIEYPYVTKAVSSITEPYWLNSIGTIIYVHKEVPLFIDQNHLIENHLCLISQLKNPYSQKRPYNELSYDIVFTKNPRLGHEFAVKNYLGKPSRQPNIRMVNRPIFTTWPRYMDAINQTVIMNLANKIKENGYKNAIIEIDDYWEFCPGSFEVDAKKYSDFKQMINDIKAMGFDVTLWVHPFVHYECEPWITDIKSKGFLVKNEEGNIYTSISNSEIKESHIDFTIPEVKSWWLNRVMDLQKKYNLDGLKFCAGESMFTTQIAVQNGDVRLQPSLITSEYVRSAENISWNIMVRPGQRTQDLPVFVYMGDKDFNWTFDNGLPTVVTSLLQINMNGYPYVIANMINSNDSYKENKELYIRWIQACTFIPNLQMSYVPWDFDDETKNIVHKYVDLHIQYQSVFDTAMKNSVTNGTPVNPPIWWIDPTNEEAHKIWDEYLLGEDLLIAPILNKEATTRNIYLPSGQWKFGESDLIFEGNQWIYNFTADLNTLPYFKRVNIV